MIRPFSVVAMLAVSVLALATTPAFAAPTTGGGVAFQVTSLPQQARYEGLTETVGAIVAQATFAGTIKAGSSITILYSATVTNLGSGTLNNVVSGSFGGTQYGPGAVPGITVSASGNQVTLAVGADASFAQGDYVVVSQVRVNVNALGAAATTVTATASGTSSAPTTNPITFTQAIVPVASIVNPSLSVTFAPQTSAISTCNIAIPPVQVPVAINRGKQGALIGAGSRGEQPDRSRQGAASPPVTGGFLSVTVTERYPAALTSATDESSFTPSFPPGNGTALSVTFTNVPAGMAVLFDISDSTATNATYIVPVSTYPAFQVSTGAPMVFLFYTSFSSTSAISTLTTYFELGYPNAAGTQFANGSITPLGTTVNVQASVSLTDYPTTGKLAFAANTEGGPTTVATVGDCVTNLLFPFLTNQVGFDTTVTISNTTANALAFGTAGASAQNGTCALTFYPTDLTTQTASSAGTQGTALTATSPTIAAGGVYSFQQSGSTFANQSGYMFAVCRFLDAHGFSFVTNGNASTATISQGLLALVIPNSSIRLPAANYESLGH